MAWRGGRQRRDIIGTAEASQDEETRSSLDEACEFLLTELHDDPVAAKVVKRNALDAGITAKTLRLAAEKCSVVKTKGGFDQGWTWSLPGR